MNPKSRVHFVTFKIILKKSYKVHFERLSNRNRVFGEIIIALDIIAIDYNNLLCIIKIQFYVMYFMS